ncbi:hypothetical protein MMMDOFMJ_0923 [Methylobacterium gnaphalii]|nr:hypothetical protein MMMDOFMJ_0923 [Methylobacterium gnaphalii]
MPFKTVPDCGLTKTPIPQIRLKARPFIDSSALTPRSLRDSRLSRCGACDP